MRSIVAVTTAATVTKLTTRDRVKSELGITDDATDALIDAKIDEASSAIGAYLCLVPSRETVTETFRPDGEAPEHLLLNRTPVASITSAAEDGTTVDSDEYEVDAKVGALYRLDASGYRSIWIAAKSIVVIYAGGWLLPSQSGRNLPEAIEAGAIALVRSFWMSRRRDPLVKATEIPGVMSQQYWVGGVGADGLPPDVVAMIAPFRRECV